METGKSHSFPGQTKWGQGNPTPSHPTAGGCLGKNPSQLFSEPGKFPSASIPSLFPQILPFLKSTSPPVLGLGWFRSFLGQNPKNLPQQVGFMDVGQLEAHPQFFGSCSRHSQRNSTDGAAGVSPFKYLKFISQPSRKKAEFSPFSCLKSGRTSSRFPGNCCGSGEPFPGIIFQSWMWRKSFSWSLLIAVLPGKVRSAYFCLILSGNAVNRTGTTSAGQKWGKIPFSRRIPGVSQLEFIGGILRHFFSWQKCGGKNPKSLILSIESTKFRMNLRHFRHFCPGEKCGGENPFSRGIPGVSQLEFFGGILGSFVLEKSGKKPQIPEFYQKNQWSFILI
ncbi:PREDICTED: uncharacterized protein LOC108449090 [Corvus brachyrhynchos]|uniref:uncharacterized protein LOC108449090 n=1 Tax=Corvus brachyrhynchos TaxID=85066 RepID=UPI00081634AF|nr:PREDICTED: uncharacterized protein LOC108449090 [Corvus brachyrhynchos]